jgi:sugar lactone lactonase YvrE
VTEHTEVVVALAARARLGEGPIWDVETGELVWVDILGRRVHRYRPDDGATRAFATPSDVGAVALRADGGLVLALADGFWACASDGTGLHRVATLPGEPEGTRMNDGAVDPAGRFWAGTMASDGRPGMGSLYRLDADGSVTTILRGVGTSNGIDWSPDSRSMYYIDTPTHRVDVFDFDVATGELDGRRPLVTMDDASPDGMTVDAEGCLWVATWGGASVRRYTPGGALDRVVRLPVSQVTSCAFGGSALDQLYVTSAWDGLTEDARAAEPEAGSLFRAEPGMRGRPPFRFAG